MPIQLRCSNCQTLLNAPDSARGKKIRCGKCQTILAVPDAAPAPLPPAKPPTANLSKPPTQAGGQRPPATPRPPSSATPKKPTPAGDLFGDILGSPSPSAPGFGSPSPSASKTLGGPTPQATNPYASPTSGASYSAPRSYAGASPSGRSPALYMISGGIILGWSILLLLGTVLQVALLVWVLSNAQGRANISTPELVGDLVGRFIGFCLAMAMLYGSINMVQRKNLSASRSAAIIAAIPCFGCLVFPVGIWACVLLFSDAAKGDFRS